ncbi:uncharacterized protein Z518_05561 [Rhinocladiella mackenziei CBS 650.93]|uniref:Uncharacterized protein n=1 Tax=Rhinocladiella mackenziei CBS 650.93 TaxID=1442369 RepID=A0A0D2INH7_9EURO|nr:uncharacterized protein Z518_05561 [Rhinocladiella mackenziei CBS 650.93]KIX04691.1 hypothetical protein Z518_05561 [Rhinocladiella mackenziei CBS 650.93]
MDPVRLRRTFKYPSDDEGADLSHDEMDEEEQERLLNTLRASESSTNTQYTLIFTALPLIVMLPFLYYLFHSTFTTMALLCLLGITSLASSAYMMYYIPISNSSSSSSSSSSLAARSWLDSRWGLQRGQLPALMTSEDSPINKNLPLLNLFICVLLLGASFVYRSRTDVPEGLWLFMSLPGVIFGMVFMARRSMGEIQAGLNELQGLRYEYRGA